MKKYFIYEIKKNLRTAVTITILSCAVYLISVFSANYMPLYFDGYVSNPNSHLYIPFLILMGLCTLVPILMFQFKMNARQVDCFYSLPLRREKVYLVKSAVGLLLTLAPYTIAFWLGFAATALKDNAFALSAFVPAYFLSIPWAVLLFGINAFVFTRANRTADGVIFIVLYSCAAAMAFLGVSGLKYSGSLDNIGYWFTYSPLAMVLSKYMALISNRNYYNALTWGAYIFAIASGVASWAGLFLTARKEKAEKAEGISDSLFGYRVLIPFYLVIALEIFEAQYSLITMAIFIIIAFVGYVVFRRSIKLKAKDWLVLFGATVLGIILSILRSQLYFHII